MKFDEPRRHPKFLLLLALVALATVPFPFIGAEVSWFLGLPLWLWWSFSFTALLSLTTVWGLVRLWHDDRHH